MAQIEVHRVSSDEQYDQMFEIRRVVFHDEQNVPEEIEVSDDHVSHHYLAYFEGTPCGTARWRVTPFGKVKLERFAVLKEYRGKGIGAALVQAVLGDVPKTMPIYLNAQADAISFYERLGFSGVGERFEEAGIEHLRMEWKQANPS